MVGSHLLFMNLICAQNTMSYDISSYRQVNENKYCDSSCMLLFQQWRLMPYVAAMYALGNFSKTFFMDFVEVRIGLMLNDNSVRQVRMVCLSVWLLD